MDFMQTALNFNGLKFPNQQITLTKQEKKLYELLPVGKENAVQGSYLANILHINKRTVISIVRKLRLKHFDVGSTTNNGYYRFKTPKEYMEYIKTAQMEYIRRGQVLKAMKYTPMAQKIAITVNEKEA